MRRTKAYFRNEQSVVGNYKEVENLGAQEFVEDPDRLLTVPQAAELLQLSPKTLANWASAGHGPRRVKLTARDIRYRRSDLIAFISDKLESA